MFRKLAIFAVLAAGAEAFAPMGFAPRSAPRAAKSAVSGLSMQRSASVKEMKAPKLTPELFNKLDKDNSGKIDMAELGSIFNNRAEGKELLKKADLNGDGEIDYAEYERLMNMQKYDDDQGGNLYVRNAISAGFLREDSVLADCVMVGNKGFDPFNCATTIDALNKYREAELKHGRLAMLAAAGWPVSELVQPYLSKYFNAPDLLAAGERSPSILNGGLDQVNPIFFLSVLVFTAVIEGLALRAKRPADWIPGDLGFDPLNIYRGATEFTKRDLELKELNNGRLAMLAITWYAIEEATSGSSVVTNSPQLFKSLL